MTGGTTKDAAIRQRVVVGTISNYVGQLVAFGTLFFLTPFILRQLGVAAYGLWVLAGSVVAYASLLDVGIWGAVIKYVAEFRARGEEEQARQLLATAFALYSGLGALAVGLSLGFASLFPTLFNVAAEQRGLAVQLAALMGAGVGLSLPCMMPMAVLRGLQRYDLVNAATVFGSLFTALATVAVLWLGGGVVGLVAVNLAGMVAMQLPALWFIRRVAPDLRWGWRGASRAHARRVLGFSWPLFVVDVASRLQTRSDEIVIGALLLVSAVTPYSFARRLSEVTHILTKQFMKVLLPLASELHAEQDAARLRQLYLAGTRLTLAIFLPIGGALAMLARPILTLWVGAEYAAHAPLVAILTVASLVATSQWPASAVLQGMARHRLLAATALASGLANLALSLALARPYGLVGVALGTLVPTVVEGLGFVLPYAMRTIGVRPMEMLREVWLPALLPALPMAALLWAGQRAIAPTSLAAVLALAAAGALAYGVGYLAVGATPLERQSYRALAHRTLRLASAPLRRS